MQSNNADHRYDYAIAQMREQFQKFSEKCDMYNTSMTLPEGKDINLVDGRTYAYNGLSSFDPQEYFYRCFPGPMPYTSPFPFAPNSFTSMVHNSIAMWDSVSDFKNQNPDVQNLDAMKKQACGKWENIHSGRDEIDWF